MTNSLTFFEVTGHYDAVSDPAFAGVINDPLVQAIQATVTFTPRLAKGQLLYVQDFLITDAYNAEQTVNLLGEPISGTWTLQFGTDITDPLPWDATPTQVQTALRALPSIGAGNVNVVADLEPQAFDVEFTGTLGNQQIPVLIGDADLLVNAEGEGFCEVTVAPTALGSPQIIADTAIALPVRTARIWNGVLSTIDRTDTPGVQLTANTQCLNLGGPLIYDVTFDNITFNSVTQVLAPFAITAPIDGTPMDLTDPQVPLLPYQRPIATMWTPPSPLPGNGNTVMLLADARRRSNWRTRATA